MCIPLRGFEVCLGLHAVTEWPTGQLGQLTRVAVCKGNRHPVSREIPQARERIGGKTRLGLLTVRYDRRPSFFQAGNRVAQGSVFDGMELLVRNLSGSTSPHRRQQVRRSGDTSNWLCRDRHLCHSFHLSWKLKRRGQAELAALIPRNPTHQSPAPNQN